MISKLLLIYKKSFIGQAITRFKRNLKSKNKKSRSTVGLFSGMNINFPEIPKFKIIVLAIVVATLSIGLFRLISNYFSVSFERFDLSEEAAPRIVGGDETTFVFYVYEEVERESYSYFYIDQAVVISARQDKLIAYVINPNFEISAGQVGKTNINTYLNKSYEFGQDRFSNLNKYIQRYIGVRVDRYIAMTKENFINMGGSSLKTDIEVSSDTLSNYSSIEDYAYSIGEVAKDKQIEVQADFLESFLKSNFRFGNLISYLINPESFTSKIKSDFSGSEFIQLVNRISANKSFKIVTLTSRLSVEREPKIILEPDFLLIDNLTKSTFQDLGVLSEQSEIEIYNASSKAGLAGSLSREFQNLGANVVKYGNYFEESENNKLFVFSEEDLSRYKNTINMIRKSLRGDIEIIVGEYEYNHTGDLILVLGE